MGGYTSPPIRVGSLRDEAPAELVFGGVEQAGPSWQGRVFVNNPTADERTPPSAEAGYVGSFDVFGYGEPLPPALAEARANRPAGGPPVAPIEKRMRADEGALRAALGDADELTVTVVPVPADPGGATPERPFETVDVVFGRGAGG